MKKAVVLAAGKGVRLKPFTNTRPKHLIPIAGAPIIAHCLNAIGSVGIESALIVAHYMIEKLKAFLGDAYANIKLTYLDQGGVYGTAHAASLAKDFVGDEDFLLIYGDVAFDYEILKVLVRKHEEEKPDLTIATAYSPRPQDFGVVVVDGDRLICVKEKPEQEVGTPLVNCGIYVTSPYLLKLAEKTPLSERGEYELTHAINQLVKRGGVALVVRVGEDSWVDVGRPWNILDANRLLLNKLVKSSDVRGVVEEGVAFKGPVMVEEGAKIKSGSYIEGPAWISSGCEIGPNCYLRPYTYLGRGVKVGSACEIKESILMDGTHVGHLSYVGDSVIGECCNLGAGTITANLRFDEAPVKVTVKGERVSSGRRKLGVLMGDGVRTGVNVSFSPGVSVGEFSWVGPHVFVNSDVPPYTAVLLKRQELEFREMRK